ncbi:hypothetical protein [Myxococcus sp. Y35]|uniref:hypothetical protein n=1 Tax=Pseudomyxococcus flavus TaxID=3115648 RepID=UPI003CF5DD5C
MTSLKAWETARPWFLLLPFPAMLLGAFTAWRSGAPAAAFALNAVATALGAGVALVAGRQSSMALPRVALPLAVIAVLLTASTLLFPGIEGVHRWLGLGPVRLHASAVATPWVLLGMSATLHQRFAVSAALALGVSTVHAAQPDAGQGTAFALAASLLLVRARPTSWRRRLVCCAGVLVLGFGSWLRPDPLAAVPHVERIVQLAAGLAPALGAVAVLALALLLVPMVPGVIAGADLSIGLAVYVAATLCVPALGNFPVPIMGAGAGPVLGWYMAMGILMAARRPPGAVALPPDAPAMAGC